MISGINIAQSNDVFVCDEGPDAEKRSDADEGASSRGAKDQRRVSGLDHWLNRLSDGLEEAFQRMGGTHGFD